jgi:butyryl-CoA dehydrogenase
MAYRDTLDFLLHDWLKAETLSQRERHAEHSRETFDAVLDMCERIARDKYAPFNRQIDTEEPRIENGKVVLPACTYAARDAYAESGMLSAAQDAEYGGMQLPYTVEAAANSFFALASVSMGSSMLTTANAGLIRRHGTPMQREVFANNEFNGRWAGTMCLSEPQAGSGLSDVLTRAVPDGEGHADDPLGPRYRLTGNKMWISAGEHELTENIVHLVLAKIPGPDGKLVPGTRGISLFIVPRKLVNTAGELTGQHNDVALAGLNHKCGWRGVTNTLLNFGEGKHLPDGKPGAVGYLIGEAGKGLHCMFHMMNTARIGVGMSGVLLGLAGYYASLDYAKTRTQGRPLGPAGKDPSQPPVRIIEHADVKRMLLTQKAYGEGALALNLFAARLVDDTRTGTPGEAARANLLLEVLTPICKSWPAEFCLEANSLAIQIHGGYGYTRDFPVEQYWRDQRLNMIHEGTHGIQAIDLLNRKVRMDGGAGLKLLGEHIDATVQRAIHQPALAEHANALAQALAKVGAATKAAWATEEPQAALANAVPYMQAFGHMVIAWMWLEVALATLAKDAQASAPASQGRLAATRYFFHYELPKLDAWLKVVSARDLTCAEVDEAAF